MATLILSHLCFMSHTFQLIGSTSFHLIDNVANFTKILLKVIILYFCAVYSVVPQDVLKSLRDAIFHTPCIRKIDSFILYKHVNFLIFLEILLCFSI